LSAGDLGATNFLGLAEIRLQENNLARALTLLRRMVLISGEGFANLDPAAVLLEKTGHAGEAVEFLAALVKAEPWNADARERLAAAQKSGDALAAIAKSGDAPYRVRVAAASAIRRMQGPALTGTEAELVLLSSANPPWKRARASRICWLLGWRPPTRRVTARLGRGCWPARSLWMRTMRRSRSSCFGRRLRIGMMPRRWESPNMFYRLS
jgi:hypothetical protein